MEETEAGQLTSEVANEQLRVELAEQHPELVADLQLVNESLDAHMTKGSIEKCPVMGQMSAQAQEFIVKKVTEHADKAASFKGMDIAAILAKKSKITSGKPTVATAGANAEPFSESPATIAAAEQIMEATDHRYHNRVTELQYVTTQGTDTETTVNSEEPIKLVKPLAELQAPRISTIILTENVAQMTEQHTEMHTETTKELIIEAAHAAPETRIRPTHVELASSEQRTDLILQKEVSFTETEHSVLPIQSDTVVEARVDAAENTVLAENGYQPIFIRMASEKNLVSGERSTDSTEYEIQEVLVAESLDEPRSLAVQQATDEVHEYLEPLFIALDDTMTVSPYDHEMLIDSLIDEVRLVSIELSEDSEDAASEEVFLRLITRKLPLLSEAQQVQLLPLVKRLFSSMHSEQSEVIEKDYDQLNAAGTHEFKFYASWKSKGLTEQVARYYRVSSYLLRSVLPVAT